MADENGRHCVLEGIIGKAISPRVSNRLKRPTSVAVMMD